MEEKLLRPGSRTGRVTIPASKSRAHRLLIMAALSDAPVTLECNGFSNDILATVNCLNALGCSITTEQDRLIHIDPLYYTAEAHTDTQNTQHSRSDHGHARSENIPENPSENRVYNRQTILPCRDSGSTLRFLLPLAGALNATGCFEMEGRLPERPLSPYDDELRAHGMKLERHISLSDPENMYIASDNEPVISASPENSGNSFTSEAPNRLYFSGQLQSGRYTLPGDVSSQYISGLLMSLPMLEGDSELHITGRIESGDYIRMTEDALKLANISFSYDNQIYKIPGGQRCHLPERLNVEGDWSGAAFFLCLGALVPEGIHVDGIDPASLQGDKAIIEILDQFGADIHDTGHGIVVKHSPLKAITVDAAGIPDLVPVISVVAAAAKGTTRIINAGRLRLKESDRLQTTAKMLTDLGARITEGSDSLVIEGCDFPTGCLKGGRTDSFNDHRIAMSAAVASAICRDPVIIENPDCVKKSFANFWEIFETLS